MVPQAKMYGPCYQHKSPWVFTARSALDRRSRLGSFNSCVRTVDSCKCGIQSELGSFASPLQSEASPSDDYTWCHCPIARRSATSVMICSEVFECESAPSSCGQTSLRNSELRHDVGRVLWDGDVGSIWKSYILYQSWIERTSFVSTRSITCMSYLKLSHLSSLTSSILLCL